MANIRLPHTECETYTVRKNCLHTVMQETQTLLPEHNSATQTIPAITHVAPETDAIT